MSPEAIDARLAEVVALNRLCASLAEAKPLQQPQPSVSAQPVNEPASAEN